MDMKSRNQGKKEKDYPKPSKMTYILKGISLTSCRYADSVLTELLRVPVKHIRKHSVAPAALNHKYVEVPPTGAAK